MKRTPEREQRILEAITGGATRRAAALHAGIDESTLWRWMQNATFASRIARAEADVEVRCTALILSAAQTDPRHAEWWLERRRPDDYGRRDRTDIELYIRTRAIALGLDQETALSSVRSGLRALSTA